MCNLYFFESNLNSYEELGMSQCFTFGIFLCQWWPCPSAQWKSTDVTRGKEMLQHLLDLLSNTNDRGECPCISGAVTE